VPRGRDDVALAQRAPEEGALQRLRLALQAQVRLCGREDDARRGLRFHLPHLDEIARADAGIGALQAIDAQDLDPLILGIRPDGARRRRLLADDLDHVALAHAQRGHQAARQVREAAAGILRTAVRHLDFTRRGIAVGHPLSSCRVRSKRAR